MRRSSIQLTFSQMLEDFSLMYNIQTLEGGGGVIELMNKK